MLFAIVVFLKPGADGELEKLSGQLNEQIGPNAQNISAAGALRGEDGRRAGYLAFFEGDSIADARAWAQQSPIYRAGLYDRLDVLEYDVEIGRVG